MAEAENHSFVAVINSNKSIIDLIRLFLNDEGIPSIGGLVPDFKRGRQDWIAFLKSYNPKVIIYDIAYPYEENWKNFQLVKDSKEAEGRLFILTTTDKSALEQLVGETNTIEILGKPFDLNKVVTVVKQKLQI